MRDRQQLVQQSRHQVASGVQAGAGRATHRGHQTPHDEADHNRRGGRIRSTPRQAQAAQRAEHEHQRAEELVDEIVDLRVIGVGGAEGAEDGVRLLGVAIVRVVGHEHDQLAHKRTEQLGDDIREHFTPGEHAVDGLGQRHGRVDVRAGDAAEHEHGEHDAEAIAHGDGQPAGMMALGVFQFHVRHGAVAEHHEDGRADEFGCQFGKERVFHADPLSSLDTLVLQATRLRSAPKEHRLPYLARCTRHNLAVRRHPARWKTGQPAGTHQRYPSDP